jgi:uncharacterized protein
MIGKCFYHNDLDGLASAAIVRKKYPEIPLENFIEINYGWPFPWDIIKSTEKVIMVDFCLQPFEDMRRLHCKANLTWIDHHKTALAEYQKHLDDDYFPIEGLRKIGRGACELTWNYYFPNKPVPRVIHLLSSYDVWDLYEEDILAFQMGMRAEDYRLNHHFWIEMLDNQTIDNDIWVDDIIENGLKIVKWEDIRAKEYCKAYAIETFISGHRAIAVNVGRANSQFFLSTFNHKDYPIFIYFCRLPSDKWTVGLMSETVDVGEIAKSFGGGGHAGAAGFSCENLPFEV